MSSYSGYPSIDKIHLKDSSFFEKNPIIPSVSIANTMSFLWANCPNDPAINCLDLSATHKELLTDAKVIAKSFKELGIKKGEIICVSMPNYYQAVAAFIAANRIGAIITFLNPFSKDEELIQQLNKYESPLLINYDKDREYNNLLKNSQYQISYYS